MSFAERFNGVSYFLVANWSSDKSGSSFLLTGEDTNEKYISA